jgi:uncharacterized protein YbaR (Trm112 family)/SAM-dependent methyltransferase
MEKRMNLYDILACPKCQVHIERQDNALVCSVCGQTYPIINGIPVVLPNGEIPAIQHETDLAVRSSYDPWVHRVILQSLFDNQIVVEIGAGNMALDDPCIIRTDVMLSPYVDLVADVHALPFLPASIDYIFSLAVFEHVRNPFLAAQSIYQALKDGGYIYHECNFVFAYHGYPHHYFNATLQGMEQIFANFVPLCKGVATYQMPAFALDMVLRSYLKNTHAHEYPHGKYLVNLIQKIIDLDLTQFDIYFSENNALNVAAGTYFAGMKKITSTSTLIPAMLHQIWASERDLQTRFPNIADLTKADNIMAWALQTGRVQHAEIDRYLREIEPFSKHGGTKPWNREHIRSLAFEEPRFGAIGFNPDNSMSENAKIAMARHRSNGGAKGSWRDLLRKAIRVRQAEGIQVLATKAIKQFQKRITH